MTNNKYHCQKENYFINFYSSRIHYYYIYNKMILIDILKSLFNSINIP